MLMAQDAPRRRPRCSLWLPALSVRSDSEDLGLGGCELLVGEDALSVKVCQVLKLRGRVVHRLRRRLLLRGTVARPALPTSLPDGAGPRPCTAVAVPATTAVRAAMRRSPNWLPLDLEGAGTSLPQTFRRRESCSPVQCSGLFPVDVLGRGAAQRGVRSACIGTVFRSPGELRCGSSSLRLPISPTG